MTVSQRENLMRVASRRPLCAVLALLTSVAVFAALLLAAPPPARADLAASDSFPGWTTTVTGSPEFVVTADTADAHDGAAAARVDFDTPYSASYVDLRQNIRANGGVTYDMSVWVRTQDLSASDAAYVVLSGDHAQRVELPAGTNDWTRLEWSYTHVSPLSKRRTRLLTRTDWSQSALLSERPVGPPRDH